MNIIISGFISIWLYLSLAVGFFLVVFLICHWKKWNWQKRLGTMAVITLTLHVWEEWVIPGGFYYLYNVGSPNYPMSQLTDSITNFAGIILGLIVVLYGINNISAFVIAFICLFEGIAHCVLLVIKSYHLFAPQGDVFFYNPGQFTALFCFVPIGIGLVIYFIRHHPTVKQLLLGIIAAAAVNSIEVALPEALLKNPASPYAFSEKGYYKKFKTILPGDPAYKTSHTLTAQ